VVAKSARTVLRKQLFMVAPAGEKRTIQRFMVACVWSRLTTFKSREAPDPVARL
jgi:hypothetical protein